MSSLLFLPLSCKNEAKNSCCEGKTGEVKESFLRTEVISAEVRATLSIDDIIEKFKQGNERFVNSELTARDHSKLVTQAVEGQHPLAVVLSCIDSRVPVEDIFDKSLGDIFVVRVAGNFANVDILGSMEYSCKVAGAKLLVVMGHDHCGAVKGAIDNVELGNLTALLKNLKPAVEMSTKSEGQRNSKNEDFVQEVAMNNVSHTIEFIRKNSPILKEMEDKGEIKMVGAYYDLETGKVAFFEEIIILPNN